MCGKIHILYPDDVNFLVVVDKDDLYETFKSVSRAGSLDVYGGEWSVIEFLHSEEIIKQLYNHIRNKTLWYSIDDLDEDDVVVVELEIVDGDEVAPPQAEKALRFAETYVDTLDNVDVDCEATTMNALDIYFFDNLDWVEKAEEIVDKIENNADAGDFQGLEIACLLPELLESFGMRNPEVVYHTWRKGGSVLYEIFVDDDGRVAVVRRI